MISVKVEIGLDLGAASPVGFTLDDATKGLLDSSSYVLGGSYFYDITDRLQSVSIERGKNQALGKIDSGTANLVLSNNDRQFDPLYEAGAYFGALVPRKEVRITANGFPVYFGYIDDLDLSYSPDRATVQISCVDGFSVLSNAVLQEYIPAGLEASGTRIENILDLPEVDWSADLRDISPGDFDVLDNTVSEGTVALSYLQEVDQAEFGQLFMAKDGKLVFQDRNYQPLTPDTYLTDDFTIDGDVKIPYVNVQVTYGSEFLYNRIVVSNGIDEAIAGDTLLQQLYGVRTLELTGLLSVDLTDLTSLANKLLATYKLPSYRFEAISVVMTDLTTEQTDAVLDLEIGDIIQVHFTPSGIPPAIEQSAKIIGISHDWSTDSQSISFALETLGAGAGQVLTLNSDTLGILDSNVLG